MKVNISKASYEGREFDFGDAKLGIRPYPLSRADVAIKDGALIFSGGNARDMFIYCLVRWDGVIGADDLPLRLTEDVKKKVYDFKLISITDEKGDEISMSDFVIRKAREMTEEIAADAKN